MRGRKVAVIVSRGNVDIDVHVRMIFRGPSGGHHARNRRSM